MLLITRGQAGTGVLREQRREMAVVVEVGAGAVPGRTVHRPARQDHERHRAWPVLGRERGLALALEVPGTVPGVDKIEGDPVGVEPGSVRGAGPVLQPDSSAVLEQLSVGQGELQILACRRGRIEAVADLVPENVPEALLERKLVGPPVVAVGQQAGLDGVLGHYRCPPFAHGCLRGMRAAILAQPQSLVTQQPGRLNQSGVFGQRGRDASEGRDGAAERLAFRHVAVRFVEAGHGGAQALQADGRPAVVEMREMRDHGCDNDSVSPTPAQQAQARRIAAEITARLAGLPYALPGTVADRMTRCGHASCRCHADPPQLHGPYHQWTRKKNGRTATRILSDDQLAGYGPWFDNCRRLRELIAELEELSLAITETDPRRNR
jgi:hypothetical protein